MNNYKVAVIPGDGIGVDVIKAAWQVLELSAAKHHFSLQGEWFPWSCDYYLEHGEMMPEDGIATLRQFNAILLGAVGWPQRVPDNVSLHGLLLPIRKQFDLFANVRPHRLLPGVRGPLREENFDILCIRENTEGEYSGAGGRIHQGTPQEVAVETSIFTRQGVERILRYGFEAARQRSGRLASVTKSNAQKYTMVMWDEITDEIAKEYPDVKVTRYHIDAIAARFVMQPESLDVVVASNLFGDILTDLGAAIQGGLGYAASANLNPDPAMPSMFEPVHGSAPDIAGQNIANPLAAIWSGALMLEHLGEQAAAQGIMQALERVTAEIPLNQTQSTAAITDAVLRLI
ncbi:tartrate dehydrogenase/decarboxylase/D-malate dehydrogenase [Erwinia toletana]|uniref:Tartrate dehydrogenase/decarboxylase/D-malate dehydrogenase n=1 Tax=Winslowiella toletana TaxID=92490 RepID=A0ABS4PCG1_9GAMM|nr:tartrate dehydrogenase [Winslowiella toletana]MBP2169618.1 tartrate dehydrogenase/decarboxylase/D-malate dehydrogenase [Winslowiella toletana]